LPYLPPIRRFQSVYILNSGLLLRTHRRILPPRPS
jgi:hypothetical protein